MSYPLIIVGIVLCRVTLLLLSVDTLLVVYMAVVKYCHHQTECSVVKPADRSCRNLRVATTTISLRGVYA